MEEGTCKAFVEQFFFTTQIMPYLNTIHCLSAPGLSGVLPSALFSMLLFLAINHLIDVCSTCLITESIRHGSMLSLFYQ